MPKALLLRVGVVGSLLLLLVFTLIIYRPVGMAHGAANNSVITTPANVTATTTTSQSITLSWSASTDNSGTGDVPAYSVYNGSSIVATSMGTAVTVSSLLPATRYTFTVQAYDKDGNTSGQSTPLSTSTQAASSNSYQKIAYF